MFQGAVLGHGGATLQRIQRLSGTKIELHDSNGNLNGAHPDAGSTDLHALLASDSAAKLQVRSGPATRCRSCRLQMSCRAAMLAWRVIARFGMLLRRMLPRCPYFSCLRCGR